MLHHLMCCVAATAMGINCLVDLWLLHAGKLYCLKVLLDAVIQGGNRAVIVSTSTSTLDLIDNMLCQAHGYD